MRRREHLVRAVSRKDDDSYDAALDLCLLLKPPSIQDLIDLCWPAGVGPMTFDILADAFEAHTVAAEFMALPEARKKRAA